MEEQPGQDGQLQGLLVGDGQDAGQAQADGADVGIGGRAEFIGAAAPHFGFGFELDVGFQPDDSFVIHKQGRLRQGRRGQTKSAANDGLGCDGIFEGSPSSWPSPRGEGTAAVRLWLCVGASGQSSGGIK